jgi:hypothetical protein
VGEVLTRIPPGFFALIRSFLFLATNRYQNRLGHSEHLIANSTERSVIARLPTLEESMLALSGNPGLHYAPHLHPSSTNTSTGTFTSPTDLYYHPGSTPISTSVPTPSHSSTQIFPVDYSTPFISTRSRIKEDLSSGSGQLDLYHNSKDTQSQGPAEGMHRKMEEMKQ